MSAKIALLAKLLAAVAAALLVLLGLIWLFQRRLIYLPLDHDVPEAASVLERAEEVAFQTRDGVRLAGWFVPAAGGDPRATVLVCNGNAGNRSYRAPLAAALAAEGFSVVLFDYRGYGGNPGRPTERGLLEDVRAARGYVESREDVDPRRLVLFGESLGAAVCLAEAVGRPPTALVLRSPFTSLVEIGRTHYPFLPVSRLLADRYPSIERVAGLRCPLLVFAGAADMIVPAAQSRRLFEAAPGEVKRMVLLRGGHNDMELLAGERLIGETTTFITESLAAEAP